MLPSRLPEGASGWAAIKHLGWRYWVGLVRRAAPWVLLVFALMQVKTLNEKLRSVENDEFAAVKAEVRALRGELQAFRDDAARTHHALDESRDWVNTVDESLDRARKRAPEVAHRLGESESLVSALEKAIPATDSAAALATELHDTTATVGHVRSALPSIDASNALATNLSAASTTVAQLRSTLPEPAKGSALGAAVDTTSRHLQALDSAVPKADDAQALAKLIQAEAARLKSIQDALPSVEQVDALRRTMERTQEAVARLEASAASEVPKQVAKAEAHVTSAATPEHKKE